MLSTPSTSVTTCMPTPAESPPSSILSDSTNLSSCSRSDEINIPDHWRPEIEQCIKDKCFSASARKEIVRSLVSQLYSRSRKPTRHQCEDLARKFILKFPFAKDDLGNGYVSCVPILSCTLIILF